MTYCLMTEDGKLRIEIRCLVQYRPECINDLLINMHSGYIMLVSPKTLPKKYRELSKAALMTDWERTGVGLRQINWIATENL